MAETPRSKPITKPITGRELDDWLQDHNLIYATGADDEGRHVVLSFMMEDRSWVVEVAREAVGRFALPEHAALRFNEITGRS